MNGGAFPNGDAGQPPRWPVAAASRVRVTVGSGGAQFCRLFHNASTGAVELVACTAEDLQRPQPAVYDDSDARIAEEPSYQSYLATASDERRVVADAFHPDDVIGAHLSLEYNARNPNTFHGMQSYAAAVIKVYSYPKAGKRQKRKAAHKTYILDPRCCEDFADARLLIRCIQQLSKLRHATNPLKCLVILNPYSGGGGTSSKTGARNVYQTMVKPMLAEAGVDHDALVTRRGGHAQERMGPIANESDAELNGGGEKKADAINTDPETQDISEYDAIIAMGGDGILFEIFQGLLSRPDAQTIISKLKFGIVACGTYNGLAKSLLHWSHAEYNRIESVFQICKGHTAKLDVARYEVLAGTGRKSYASFLSFAWGLIADCDFESECLRWLGHIRSDIWAVWRGILRRRRYRARFSYLPPGIGKEVVVPEMGEPLPEGWESFEDNFLVFWVCNTSHAAHNMHTCPVAKMNDGLFHVLVVRSSCSRWRLLQMLLQLETGGHHGFEECEVIDCVAYQFEPLSKVSYNVLDGELLEDGPVQAKFMPSEAQFFAGEAVEYRLL
ncbi:hypothetical protein ACHAXT_010838 [Thalassiosira profunda]